MQMKEELYILGKRNTFFIYIYVYCICTQTIHKNLKIYVSNNILIYYV